MNDYFVSRAFRLNEQIAPRPNGPAINALVQANMQMERSGSRPERVRAFDAKLQGPAQTALSRPHANGRP